MILRVAIATLAVAVLSTTVFAAKPTALPPATDLQADARIAREAGIPVVVLIGLEGCPYCEEVRRSHLVPLDKSSPRIALVRQVELKGAAALIDFDGRKTSHAEFARHHRAPIAPVVLFFDGAGMRAAEPLVGASIPDFYGLYFESALTEARRAASAAATAKATYSNR